jgi:hypothetical protein
MDDSTQAHQLARIFDWNFAMAAAMFSAPLMTWSNPSMAVCARI